MQTRGHDSPRLHIARVQEAELQPVVVIGPSPSDYALVKAFSL